MAARSILSHVLCVRLLHRPLCEGVLDIPLAGASLWQLWQVVNGSRSHAQLFLRNSSAPGGGTGPGQGGGAALFPSFWELKGEACSMQPMSGRAVYLFFSSCFGHGVEHGVLCAILMRDTMYQVYTQPGHHHQQHQQKQQHLTSMWTGKRQASTYAAMDVTQNEYLAYSVFLHDCSHRPLRRLSHCVG